MPPRRANCQICEDSESKYVCSTCEVLYCSVSCYKVHKQNACTGRGEAGRSGGVNNPLLRDEGPSQIARTTTEELPGDSKPDKEEEPRISNSLGTLDGSNQIPDGLKDRQREGGDERIENMESKVPLRALTTVKWPYVPEPPSYPDPLARNDPKSLSLAQYEAIATSPAIRHSLSENANLRRILRALDSLRGPSREETLQRVLGVSRNAQGIAAAKRNMYIPSASSAQEEADEVEFIGEEEMVALKALAEAIEHAVHAPAEAGSLGLEWER